MKKITFRQDFEELLETLQTEINHVRIGNNQNQLYRIMVDHSLIQSDESHLRTIIYALQFDRSDDKPHLEELDRILCESLHQHFDSDDGFIITNDGDYMIMKITDNNIYITIFYSGQY
jgi:hypothetical protein